MTFAPTERSVITEFPQDPTRLDWRGTDVEFLLGLAPAAKGSFACLLVKRLAEAAGVPFGRLPGRVGSRVRVGQSRCEIKFSTEDPARFQQVRPPADGYDYLIGIAVRPQGIWYWLISASDVARLFDDDEIKAQAAESSRWFFPKLSGTDVFSPYRSNAADFVRNLKKLA